MFLKSFVKLLGFVMFFDNIFIVYDKQFFDDKKKYIF